MAHSRRSRPHEFGSGGEGAPMEKLILKYLHDHYTSPSDSVNAVKIAHGVGKQTKKDINRFLYNLKKKGLVEKVNDSPPLWRLLKYEPMMHTQSPPKATNFGSNVSTMPAMQSGTSNVVNFGMAAAPLIPPSAFVTDDTPSTSGAIVFQAKETLPKSPPRESLCNSQSKGPSATGEPSSDDFVIPPTPKDLLNDIASDFNNLNLKGHIENKEDLEQKVLQVICDDIKLSAEDIAENISGHQINDINEALRSLLAKNCVEKLGNFYSLPLSNPVETLPFVPKMLAEGDGQDFTMNDYTADTYDTSSFFFSSGPPTAAAPGPLPPPQQCSPQTVYLPEGKNAISVVNEYAQSKQWKINYKEHISGPDHKRRFWMAIEVGGQRFRGPEAQTKKDAKLKAAEVAVLALYNAKSIQAPAAGGATYSIGAQKEATLHDKVASLVNQKYNELAQMLPDMITGRKIIAGFVMTRKLKSGEQTMQVVSLGSGNRCVMGDKLSMQGESVNDCHAEVIARRGLVRYLYRELISRDEDSKFVLDEDKYTLVSGVEFHLYISTAPCGDGALFAPSDTATDQPDQDTEDGAHHPLFANKKQGVLRTKIENGEGCIPIEEDTAIPTWDGILRGERLRTMSCSDKIAKWNYLGLQGSLLTHFVKPIYMSTLTLGMLYNHGHLTRAVCCRVQKSLDAIDESLTPPTEYKMNHPVVSGQNQNRETGKMKTREFSLNWSLGDMRAEVLNGTEGKCEQRFGSTNPPRICKAQLFKEFKKLCDKNDQAILYKDGYYKSKMSATDYQGTKKVLWDALEKSGFGKWMPKPKEEKDF